MKIALLTRNPKLFSHQRIIEAARSRGHEIVPIDYLRCYMNITSRKPELRYLGEQLEGFDAVIPRIAASHTFYGLAVLRQFEMMGVYPAQRIGGHRPLARQAALAATSRARRRRPAGHRLRQRHDARPTRSSSIVGGAPGRDQAARRHARASAWCWARPTNRRSR